MVPPHSGRWGTTQPAVLQAEPAQIVTQGALLAMCIQAGTLDYFWKRNFENMTLVACREKATPGLFGEFLRPWTPSKKEVF